MRAKLTEERIACALKQVQVCQPILTAQFFDRPVIAYPEHVGLHIPVCPAEDRPVKGPSLNRDGQQQDVPARRAI